MDFRKILDDNSDLNLEFQEIADPKQLSWLEKIHARLDNVLDSVQGFKIDIPRTFQVFGKVSVDKVDQLPPIKVQNLSELHNSFLVIANQISALQKTTLQAIQALKVVVPKDMQVTNKIEIKQFNDLLDGVEELKKGFNLLINKEVGTLTLPKTAIPVEIQNWKVAQPVTNVSLNPNRGEVKDTAVTVTTTLTPLPGTALTRRRSITFYNNGSVTIYVGGANVTAATGIPVAAGLWGPSLDVGPRNIVYAVTSTGSSDIRVLEISDISGGDA